MNKKHLIVGLDLGKNSAIACLDLHGNLVMRMHGTSMGFNGIIQAITEVGVPLIIAGDKKSPNWMVRKINAAFNSRLFTPKSDITLEEKRETTKGTGIKNEHERDAYSAAIKAYNYHVGKLRQAEKIANMRSNSADAEEVMAKVIRKYSISEAMSGRTANRH
ncbi:MAG: DUF460 domain-containing protein [Candidatus Micrarchaeaceae archaeon]